MKKDWIYIGIFLDFRSTEELIQTFHAPIDWKRYCDHVTLAYNDGTKLQEISKQVNTRNIGRTVEFKVVAFGVSEKATAIKVELPLGVFCANKIPHITIAVSPEGKPVDSNDIQVWNDIATPIFLKGTINKHI